MAETSVSLLTALLSGNVAVAEVKRALEEEPGMNELPLEDWLDLEDLVLRREDPRVLHRRLVEALDRQRARWESLGCPGNHREWARRARNLRRAKQEEVP